MKRLLISILLLWSVTAMATWSTLSKGDDAPSLVIEKKRDEHTWMVEIRNPDSICTGILINQHQVLTSASCLLDSDHTSQVHFTNTKKIIAPAGIAAWMSHPYSADPVAGWKHDIAIAELEAHSLVPDTVYPEVADLVASETDNQAPEKLPRFALYSEDGFLLEAMGKWLTGQADNLAVMYPGDIPAQAKGAPVYGVQGDKVKAFGVLTPFVEQVSTTVDANALNDLSLAQGISLASLFERSTDSTILHFASFKENREWLNLQLGFAGTGAGSAEAQSSEANGQQPTKGSEADASNGATKTGGGGGHSNSTAQEQTQDALLSIFTAILIYYLIE